MCLSKLSNISNLLPLKAAKVGTDATVLQVNDSSEWLVEKRPNGCDGESAGFRCESVDHGLETQVDFS
jgi:hypothetical protein